MERASKNLLMKLFDAYPRYIPAPTRSKTVLHSLMKEGFIEGGLTEKGVELCLLAFTGDNSQNGSKVIDEAFFRITPLGVKALKL